MRVSLRPLATGLAVLVAVLGTAGALAAIGGRLGIGLVLVAGALVAWAARHNVDRMARARETGVFRVRKVHDGRTNAADRDRRRGVLGQEPAPDVR
jgi:ABC-type nickel/cobalt efflux system permease component RcnA